MPTSIKPNLKLPKSFSSKLKINGCDVTFVLPRQVLSKLNLTDGSKIYCTIVNGVIQLSDSPSVLSIPILPTKIFKSESFIPLQEDNKVNINQTVPV